MRSALSIINGTHTAITLMVVSALLFGTNLCLASPSMAATKDLLLWNVDLREIKSASLVFTASACTPMPTLTAGKAYRIKLENRTGNSLTDPLPNNFLSSISPVSISMAGMRMGMSSFEGLKINNGSSMTLEFIQLRAGSWDFSCSNQPIIATAAPRPFPPIQPKNTPSVEFLKVPKPLTEFSLTNQDERPFSLTSIEKRWTLLFFGYTYCPDICPTSLFTLASAYKKLPPAIRDELDVVFVSVDPERDTAKNLEQYTKHFHNDFSGVTGSKDQLANLADQLAAAYRLPKERSNKNYGVSHTADYFLLSPDARLVARINHERQPAELTAGISEAWHYFKAVIH